MVVLYLTFFIVVLDQVAKLLIRGFSIPILGIEHHGLFYGESIPIVGDFLKFTYVENPGIAFGIDIGIEAKLFLTLFTLALSIGIFIFLFKNKNQNILYRIGIALVLGGAIGNLIDRMFYGIIFDYAPLFYGKVVDFINFEFFDFSLFGKSFSRFPIFNIADSAVSVGVFFLLFFSPKGKKDILTNEEKNLSEKEWETSEIQAEDELNGNSDSTEK